MKSRARRNLAALTSAASLAAGAVAVTAPSAQALPIAAKGGVIALYDGRSGVVTVNPDGTGRRSVPGVTNTGVAPDWAPDGSRLVSEATDGNVVSSRITGSVSPVFAGVSDGLGSVFAGLGESVVTTRADGLFIGPSDGSYDPEHLLTGSQKGATDCDGHPSTSVYGLIAFARTSPCDNPAGPDVWTYDQGTRKVRKTIASASYPAFSADGSRLAFSRVVDGYLQLFVAAADGTGAEQVTTDPADHQGASWDPAGGRIAFDSVDRSTGVTTARILTLSDGSLATIPGGGTHPAWQPLRNNSIDRVYADGAVGDDGAASRWTFDAIGKPHVPGLLAQRSAVLVNKDVSTYAVPAVSLGANKQGAVLMTSGGSLDASAATELKRSLYKGGTVYLEGGTNLLSDKVSKQVTALGYKVVRLAGNDLASVTARVAGQITTKPTWVFVADGNEYRDPIAASTAAGSLGYHGLGVVLVTKGTTVPAATLNYLNALDPNKTNMVSVGTNARKALEKATLKKVWHFWDVSGSTNEATAVNLANFWWGAPYSASVENRWNWKTAVVGGAASATYGPMLWSAVSSLSPETAAYLTKESASIQNVQTYGGYKDYSVATRTSIGNAIAASNSWITTVWAAAGRPPVSAAQKTLRSAAEPGTPVSKPELPKVVPGQHLPAANARTGS
ncbi:hypothetical protein ABZ883_33965 [Streptomyces sp. NPDC046977]|uniref:hypothetical protein n=1 Tax=Streptomyces sp. NPDC046977 TaxID=3154703 RepID=UPI00340A84FD